MKSLLIFITGLILLGMLAFACIQFHGPRIEQDIAKRTGQVLRAQSVGEVQIGVDGRDVTLSGSVPDKSIRQNLELAIAGVEGVRVVHNELVVAKPQPEVGQLLHPQVTQSPPEVQETVVPPPQPKPKPPLPDPYITEFELSSGQLLLKGHADQALQDSLLGQAESLVGTGRVTDQLTWIEGAPEGWDAAVVAVIEGLGMLDQGDAKIVNQEITITGETSDPTAKEQIERLLASNAPGFTYQVQLDVKPELSQAAINCQQQFSQLLAEAKIKFDTGKATIKQESYDLLNRLAEVANQCPNTRLEIAGHTDASGHPAFNRYLSQSRAEAVRQYLIQQGVDSGRLVAKGYGSERPVADNATAAGRATNRRVEIIIIGEE